jgi:hypothetical protein
MLAQSGNAAAVSYYHCSQQMPLQLANAAAVSKCKGRQQICRCSQKMPQKSVITAAVNHCSSSKPSQLQSKNSIAISIRSFSQQNILLQWLNGRAVTVWANKSASGIN